MNQVHTLNHGIVGEVMNEISIFSSTSYPKLLQKDRLPVRTVNPLW